MYIYIYIPYPNYIPFYSLQSLYSMVKSPGHRPVIPEVSHGVRGVAGTSPLRRDAHSCFEMGTSKGIKRGNHLQYLLFIVGNHMKSLSSKLIDEFSTYKKCKKHCNEKWGNIIFQQREIIYSAFFLKKYCLLSFWMGKTTISINNHL